MAMMTVLGGWRRGLLDYPVLLAVAIAGGLLLHVSRGENLWCCIAVVARASRDWRRRCAVMMTLR